MEHVLGLKCSTCDKEYTVGTIEYDCPSCGGNTEVIYDYHKIAEKVTREDIGRRPDPSIWRYRELLPLPESAEPLPLLVGATPLYPCPQLGEQAGVGQLFLKDDGRNPSASFKDRATAVALYRAKQIGAQLVCAASTGNAASSTACLAAAMGMKTALFVPRKAPRAKIAQLLVFGAGVYSVNGSYDDAFDLSLAATREYGWYNRNTGYNPYTREGKKTCSYEIAEQLGWQAPDAVCVPVGDGNIISGIWKGFKDLLALGFIECCPRLYAVQAEGSAAIARAILGDGIIRPITASTVADSISVDLPRDGAMAVRAVRESGGSAAVVPDEEILNAILEIARNRGVFGEPSGAIAYAGFKRLAAEGALHPKERVVALVTGNGLKDIDSAIGKAGEPQAVEPDIASLKTLLGDA